MASRRLTNKEQLLGVEAALKSPKTPPQLKAALRKRADYLRNLLRKKR
jgi:hypothetical protein